ncbi:MAG: hypothetical protein IIB09_02025 [Bacteroidetes bacterium]|nr:hypothetical protein [Bacteroidota bacterium]
MKYIQAFLVLHVLSLSASTAQAQLRIGIHAGADAGPDAITLGVHASYPVGHSGVYVVPSVSYGFGSQRIQGEEFDFKSYRGSVRGVYPIPLDRSNDFVFAPQAGPAVYHQSFNNCSGDPACSSTGFGVNIGAGMRFNAFSVTAMAGIGDLPDASVWIGLAF